MSTLEFLSNSRDISNLCYRIGTVIHRFGITSTKFATLLNRYYNATLDLGCKPTFPLTTVVLKRHSRLIKDLSRRGVEFAVHGYVHRDYSSTKPSRQTADFEKAKHVFKQHGIPFTGFRAPFLRINDDTAQVLNILKYTYDSSQAYHWNIVDGAKYSPRQFNSYEMVLRYCCSRRANNYVVVPTMVNGVVEIPVAFPDDECMIDRLGIKDCREINQIWSTILKRTHEEGELFTLQLHPERFALCQEAFTEVMQATKTLSPVVWIATLGEIDYWWRERHGFDFEINGQSNETHTISAHCSKRATVLVRNCRLDVPTIKWDNGYYLVASRKFTVASPRRPVIGVSLDASPLAIEFLQNEGFIVEQSSHAGKYSLYLNNLTDFRQSQAKAVCREIENSDAALIRYWRWPSGAKSAMSVTGDIDSITLIDFVLRLLEKHLPNRVESGAS